MVKKERQEMANRPDNTAFTQQRLPAWQPMLSAGIVIPGFVIIGLAFIGIGVALFVTSQSIQVLEVGPWPAERTNQSDVMLRIRGQTSGAEREEERQRKMCLQDRSDQNSQRVFSVEMKENGTTVLCYLLTDVSFVKWYCALEFKEVWCQ